MIKIPTDKTAVEKRVAWLQYLNTAILTLILGVSVMVATIVHELQQNQSAAEVRIVRIETVQGINTNNISVLDSRVKILEDKYSNDLKDWVDANFIRKQQSITK